MLFRNEPYKVNTDSTVAPSKFTTPAATIEYSVMLTDLLFLRFLKIIIGLCSSTISENLTVRSFINVLLSISGCNEMHDQ